MYGIDYWQKYYGGLDNYCKMPVHAAIAGEINNIFPVKEKVVLDVGGGPGVLCQQFLKQQAAMAINLDCSIDAYLYGMRHFPLVHHRCASVDSWILTRCLCSNDLVVSIQALEHIEESKIDTVVDNFSRLFHEKTFGLISVAAEDNDEDETHKTLKPWSWWKQKFSIHFDVMPCPKVELFERLRWRTLLIRKK